VADADILKAIELRQQVRQFIDADKRVPRELEHRANAAYEALSLEESAVYRYWAISTLTPEEKAQLAGVDGADLGRVGKEGGHA
jgi:hypothetical protein